MHALEVVLLSILILFPIADLALDKYKFASRSIEYIKIAIILWVVTGFLTLCFLEGVLSVSPPGYFPQASWKGYLALVIFILFLFYMKYVIASIGKDERVRRQVIKAFEQGAGSLDDLLPRSQKELFLFICVVSVTAGVCEELIFRWYLFDLINGPMGWLLATLGSSLLFGLWHLYLGWKHVVKTALIGMILCAVYVYFESIVVAIVAHILMDVYSGLIAYTAHKHARPAYI